MAEKQRVFIPFQVFSPDDRSLNNPGLRRAWGVIPFYKNYIVAPGVTEVHQAFPSNNFHLHVSASGAGQLTAYGYETNASVALFETDLVSTETDRSRAGGYTSSKLWHFTSYGDNVVATNFEDEVQYLATPGSGLFADMITSTFKPQGRFVFSIRQNLFLAYCFLPATYDGLASGTHQELVVWSQNDNLRAFGSENVDPALIGAGYQQLHNDLGPITAGVGGDYGIIFQLSGIVRVDGPPYEFRVITRTQSCTEPLSVVRVDDDIYFWGTRGPSVLRRGESPVEVLGDGTLTRTLLDKATGFSEIAAVQDFFASVLKRIYVGVDHVNGIIRWAYTPVGDADFTDNNGDFSSAVLDYNYREGRLGVSNIAAPDTAGPPVLANTYRILAMASYPGLDTGGWGPMENVYAIARRFRSDGDTTYWLIKFELTAAPKGQVVFQTPLHQLSERSTSRIFRVRPIWTKKVGSTSPTVTVRVTSVNDPKADEVEYGPFTALDDVGWVMTHDTVYADFHSVQIEFDPEVPAASGEDIFEIEGMEIEFSTGGAYGA